MNTYMNAIRTMLVATAFALAASAHGQECSGGTDGGMDATGNHCSRSDPVAVSTATANVNTLATNTTPARNIEAASQVSRPEGAVGRAQRPAVAAKPAAAPAKGPQSASVAPRAVKVSSTTGAN